MDKFTSTWQAAKGDAKAKGQQIIEHGWEQHVIIDEPENVVYRYPRHASALAKLKDEVEILDTLHHVHFSVPIPRLTNFDGQRAKYQYIAGEVLDETEIAHLSTEQAQTIGQELGIFLAELHSVNPSLIHHKAWRQKGTLLQYYRRRIKDAPNDNQWKESAWDTLKDLEELLAQTDPKQVVVHGDLHCLNMVISQDHNHLAGVIDLSEIEIGDPHQDFRKIFMSGPRLLLPAIRGYQQAGGQPIHEKLVMLWAYVNEWSNLCFFAHDPHNATYRRAIMHLERWGQI